MFDHDHSHEILDLLRSIHHDLHTHHRIQMAQFSDLLTAQAATTQAVLDLAARIANQAPPAATPEQLDQAVSNEQSTKAAIDAIAPAPTV